MNAFRKLISPVLASLALLSPLAATPEAGANPGMNQRDHRDGQAGHHDHHQHHQQRLHTVYYRQCCHNPWTAYGSYRSAATAYRVADEIAARGYETFVR